MVAEVVQLQMLTDSRCGGEVWRGRGLIPVKLSRGENGKEERETEGRKAHRCELGHGGCEEESEHEDRQGEEIDTTYSASPE